MPEALAVSHRSGLTGCAGWPWDGLAVRHAACGGSTSGLRAVPCHVRRFWLYLCVILIRKDKNHGLKRTARNRRVHSSADVQRGRPSAASRLMPGEWKCTWEPRRRSVRIAPAPEPPGGAGWPRYRPPRGVLRMLASKRGAKLKQGGTAYESCVPAALCCRAFCASCRG